MLETAHRLNVAVPETLELLLSRRSGSAKAMRGPGPSTEELQRILSVGVRVPDHGKLAPWRFILFEGDGRKRKPCNVQFDAADSMEVDDEERQRQP